MSEPASKRPASEAVADWIVLRTPSDSDAGDRWLDLRAVSPLLRAALSVTFLPTGGFELSLTGEFGEVFDSFGGRLSSG